MPTVRWPCTLECPRTRADSRAPSLPDVAAQEQQIRDHLAGFDARPVLRQAHAIDADRCLATACRRSAASLHRPRGVKPEPALQFWSHSVIARTADAKASKPLVWVVDETSTSMVRATPPETRASSSAAITALHMPMIAAMSPPEPAPDGTASRSSCPCRRPGSRAGSVDWRSARGRVPEAD